MNVWDTFIPVATSVLLSYYYVVKRNQTIEVRSLPDRYYLPVLLLIFSAILLPVSGWQVEICTIWVTQGKLTFEFPFFLGGSINVYWARDFWYAVNAIAWVEGILGGYLIGK
jgi:hypothetical protein